MSTARSNKVAMGVTLAVTAMSFQAFEAGGRQGRLLVRGSEKDR